MGSSGRCSVLLLGALAIWTSACSADQSFFRVPLTEVPERSFILEIIEDEVSAVELVDGEPIRRVAPSDAPLYWVSLPKAELEARLAGTPTPTLVLRFALAPPDCDADFPLEGDKRGEPLDQFSPRFARLDPDGSAFEPLLIEDVPSDSPLRRVSLVVEEPRTCRPTADPVFRPLALGLPNSALLGDLHLLADGRMVGPDSSLRLIYLLREGETAPLDSVQYVPETSGGLLRQMQIREHEGEAEVILIHEDKLQDAGTLTRIPILGDRFGAPETLFDTEVLGAAALEADGNMVVIGKRGLLGIYNSNTASIAYGRPFFPVDLEGLDQMGSPYQYVISDGAGKLYSGDVRQPGSMELRPFSLLGLRETFWFETLYGPRVYSRDHGDVLHYGAADERGGSEIWYAGIQLPTELQSICPKEVDACGDARALSAVHRFRKIPGDANVPPRLLVSFLTCRAAVIFEPISDCAFGITPPGDGNDQILATVRKDDRYFVLTSAGTVFSADISTAPIGD